MEGHNPWRANRPNVNRYTWCWYTQQGYCKASMLSVTTFSTLQWNLYCISITGTLQVIIHQSIIFHLWWSCWSRKAAAWAGRPRHFLLQLPLVGEFQGIPRSAKKYNPSRGGLPKVSPSGNCPENLPREVFRYQMPESPHLVPLNVVEQLAALC